MILLLVSIVVRMLDIKQKYFPVLVVLALIGIGLSFIPIFSDFSVASDVLYEVFIPGLLFVSAYQFSAKAFKSNAPVIITLATVGMLSTVFLLGIGIYYIFCIDPSFSMECLFVTGSYIGSYRSSFCSQYSKEK